MVKCPIILYFSAHRNKLSCISVLIKLKFQMRLDYIVCSY